MNHPEDRLWNYLDGLLSLQERVALEDELTQDARLNARLNEIREIHDLLHSQELMEPSMRFAKNVMEAIALQTMKQTVRKQYINKNIVWGIGFGFVALLTGIMVYAFSSVNWSEGSKSNIKIPGDKLVSFDWANQPLLTAFMMLNVVMGLYLLDYYVGKKRRGRLEKS